MTVEIRVDTSPYRAKMPLVSVLQRNQYGDRARRVSRSDVDSQRGIAERQLHAICRDHIFLWLQLGRIRADLDSMPIGFGYDKVRFVSILNIF